MEDNFSTDGGQGAREGWGAVDEASLTCPPLTSCCAAGGPGTPSLKEELNDVCLLREELSVRPGPEQEDQEDSVSKRQGPPALMLRRSWSLEMNVS